MEKPESVDEKMILKDVRPFLPGPGEERFQGREMRLKSLTQA